MRKIAYLNNFHLKTKKMMLFQLRKNDIYLFGYNGLQDAPANWDHHFSILKDAEECCREEFEITDDEWIMISYPLKNCQHDFIIPTMVMNNKTEKTDFGNIQQLINGKWTDYEKTKSYTSFDGLTGDERLLISGLLFEFENAKLNDKVKAERILKALAFDQQLIEQFL